VGLDHTSRPKKYRPSMLPSRCIVSRCAHPCSLINMEVTLLHTGPRCLAKSRHQPSPDVTQQRHRVLLHTPYYIVAVTGIGTYTSSVGARQRSGRVTASLSGCDEVLAVS